MFASKMFDCIRLMVLAFGAYGFLLMVVYGIQTIHRKRKSKKSDFTQK